MKCHSCHLDLSIVGLIAKQNEIRFNCYNTDRKIIKCLHCDLVQLVPQWKNEELNKIYEEYNQKPDFEGQKNISKRISKYLKKYLTKKGCHLEVGCGSGDNVKYYNKKGYVVIGIDKDKSVQDVMNNIHCCDIDDWRDYNTYDFIYGLHILEHMKDPLKFINKLKEFLVKNGTILLEFPNYEDPLLTLYNIKEFRQFYYRPDHHFFYTPKTLSDILSSNKIKNYKLKRIQTYGIINHLNWLIRRKPTNIKFNIPIIDNIYKWILVNIFKKSDTLILTIRGK